MQAKNRRWAPQHNQQKNTLSGTIPEDTDWLSIELNNVVNHGVHSGVEKTACACACASMLLLTLLWPAHLSEFVAVVFIDLCDARVNQAHSVRRYAVSQFRFHHNKTRAHTHHTNRAESRRIGPINHRTIHACRRNLEIPRSRIVIFAGPPCGPRLTSATLTRRWTALDWAVSFERTPGTARRPPARSRRNCA